MINSRQKSVDKQNIAVRHNLPVQTMPFIGRADEIAAIGQRLADPGCCLLTLVGLGGIGKTRLAVEVARHIIQAQAPADGVHYIDLQPVHSGSLLVTAMTNALGIIVSGSESPRSQLLNYLDGQECLLLLDNFEQLLDGADLLADILKIAPDVKLLVTSRAALNMQEEWVWHVGGLQVPDDHTGTGIESYSAVQLFAQCARRVQKDFTLVGQEASVTHICQLVDGMPLALELAAAWTKVLSCAEIAREIQSGLDVLTTNRRNTPERHRSMQAVFDHSWRLLTEAERSVFPRLSVFRGGFRREAAEQVAGASLAVLVGLVDKSFLRVGASGRYAIQELTRQYGEECLATTAGAKEETQNLHCTYFARFLHQHQDTLRGRQQAAALDEIGAELDNLRVSWEWAAAHRMRDAIHQSMHSLYVFCHIRAQAPEGQRLFDLAVSRFEHEDSATLAYLLLAGTCMAFFNGKILALDQFPRAIRMAYTYWTEDQIALLLGGYAASMSKELTERKLFDDQQLENLFRDFLDIFRTHNQPWGINFMLYGVGCRCANQGKLEEAERYIRQSLTGFLQIGDHWGGAWTTMGLAYVCECSGRYDEALQLWQDHEDFCAEVGDRGGVVFALARKARAACKLHDFHSARFSIIQAVTAHLKSGSDFIHIYQMLLSLIKLFECEDRLEGVVELWSFLRQQADKVRASEMVNEAEQKLTLLAQQLPQAVFQPAVERGKSLHLRTILEMLSDELSEAAPLPEIRSVDALSDRELEVLRLTAAGHSNREIAHRLVLTLNTVKSHIHHIYAKLGVGSRTQAVAQARKLHIL